MNKKVVIVTAITLFFSGYLYSVGKPDKSVKGIYDKKWGAQINAFKAWDAKNSFPDNAVLFIGSSSIRHWETARFFPELKLINRGFGGSDIKAINHFFDKIVYCYKPSRIVFYAGENGIAKGLSPKAVCEDFKVFYQLCSDRLPGVEIIYISIKCSNRRFAFCPLMNKANSLIEKFCQEKPHLQYIDLASCLLDKVGVPNDEVFIADRLHLNEAGYRLWTDLLKPVLVVPEKSNKKSIQHEMSSESKSRQE